jgi:hypothetical protein
VVKRRLPKRKGPPCSICKHRDKTRIEATRIAGASLDSIAAKFSISRDALHRHMTNHVDADTRSQLLADVSVQELAQLAAAEGVSVLQYLSLVRQILMGELQLASQVHAHSATAALAGKLNETLRLLGTLSGEMSEMASRSITVNGNINILNSPVIADLQSKILEALAPFPDASSAVIRALRSFESAPAATNAPEMKVIEHAAT